MQMQIYLICIHVLKSVRDWRTLTFCINKSHTHKHTYSTRVKKIAFILSRTGCIVQHVPALALRAPHRRGPVQHGDRQADRHLRLRLQEEYRQGDQRFSLTKQHNCPQRFSICLGASIGAFWCVCALFVA